MQKYMVLLLFGKLRKKGSGRQAESQSLPAAKSGRSANMIIYAYFLTILADTEKKQYFIITYVKNNKQRAKCTKI